MLASVLIANRGEIVVRIAATLRRLGIRSVAVYSDADAGARHVQACDAALRIGPAPPSDSYLDAERIIGAALASGVEAIHPGYGFLAESADFARACAEADLVFIGPPPEAIELLGDKVNAKSIAGEAGIPVLDGLHEPGLADAEIVEFARSAEPPLLVKAAAGGGGRGMRIVGDLTELPAALSSCRAEARSAFGSDELLIERYVERSRHIEVQVLSDAHGDAIHLGERECSLQRRHQKVIEEAPSSVVGTELRERMGVAALALAKRVGYVGAGTVELIADADDPESFHFLEMNARLQVEHPVTEMVTGLDLVELQLRVASGEPLPLSQEDVRLDGHAVEARIYAEDPARGYAPSTGELLLWRAPEGEGLRCDAGVATGSVVGTHYDPMLAKLIAHTSTREHALRRLASGLARTRAIGLTTNQGLLRRLATHPRVLAGALDTAWLDADGATLGAAPESWRRATALAAALGLGRSASARSGTAPRTAFAVGDRWRAGEAPVLVALEDHDGSPCDLRIEGGEPQIEVAFDRGEPLTAGLEHVDPALVVVELEGERFELELLAGGDTTWVADAEGQVGWSRRVPDPTPRLAGDASLEAELPGTVIEVRASPGDPVEQGDAIVVLESMKMEVVVAAPARGVVGEVAVVVGETISAGQELATIEAEAEEAPTRDPTGVPA